MNLKLVETLGEAMQVRRLRNCCSSYLTNHQGQIGILEQVRWYFYFYRKARSSGEYRLYVAHEDRAPVGYGALAFRNGELHVTECVGGEYRGRGHGTAILNEMIRIAQVEGRSLVAEIWTNNKRSVALHKKAGFRLDSTKSIASNEIGRYVLSTVIPVTRRLDQGGSLVAAG